MSNNINEQVSTPSNESLLMGAFLNAASEKGLTINHSEWPVRDISDELESVLVESFGVWVQKDIEGVEGKHHVLGSVIANEIMNVREEGSASIIENLKEYLIEDLFFSEAYVEAIFTKNESWWLALYLPDIIVVDTTNGVPVIKVGIIESNGKRGHDSQYAEERAHQVRMERAINRLTLGSDNYTIQPWADRDGIQVEKAILIGDASSVAEADGRVTYPVEAVWESNLSDLNVEGVGVYCNAEAYQWVSGKSTTEQEYQDSIIRVAALAQLDENYINRGRLH